MNVKENPKGGERNPNPHMAKLLAASGHSAMSAQEMSDALRVSQKIFNAEDGLLYSPASPEYDAVADK